MSTDTSRLIATAELMVVLLSVLSGIIIAALCAWAWWRSSRGVFLILAFGTVAFLYVNAFTAVVLFFGLSHIRLVPVNVLQPLYAAQAVFGFVGTVLSFFGIFFLVRLALLACPPSHLTNR
jgi:hypothetical protein